MCCSFFSKHNKEIQGRGSKEREAASTRGEGVVRKERGEVFQGEARRRSEH